MMKRSAVWVCSTMLTILCVLFSIPATAQERDYCWVLVDIVDYDSSEAWKKANDHESYHNEVWYALGNFSVKRVFTGKAEEWRTPPKLQGEGVRITANFSIPPTKVFANEKVTIALTIAASENSLSFFTFSGSANADFEHPDVNPGSRRTTTLFRNEYNDHHFEVGAGNRYNTIQENLSTVLREGREEGERIALRQQFYMGVSMATYYIYEWRRSDTPINKEIQEALLASLPDLDVSHYGESNLHLWVRDPVVRGENIVVHFNDFPGNRYDWVTIVPIDFPDNRSGEYYYTDGAHSGVMNFKGLEEGQYEVRAYHNWPQGGYTVQDRYPFVIGKRGTLVGVYAWTDQEVYTPNSPINVHYAGFPGNQSDWITIVPADFPDDRYKEYYYTSGNRAGVMNFQGLEAGHYEVRSYFNWPSEGYRVVDRHSFWVQD